MTDERHTPPAPDPIDEQPDAPALMLELLRRDQQRRRARNLGDGSYPGRALGGGTAMVVTPVRGRR